MLGPRLSHDLVVQHHAEAGFALHHAGVTIGSFTFEVIGGRLRAPSSRRRSKSSEIFAENGYAARFAASGRYRQCLYIQSQGAGFFRTTGSNWSQQACAISWSEASAGNSIRG